MTGIGKPVVTRKHNKSKCQGCYYQAKHQGWCNYAEITGRSRLKDGGPLNPNGGCKLYRKGERGNLWKLSPKPIRESRDEKTEYRRRQAELYRQIEANYKAGLSDVEIATAVGCGASTVSRWRFRHGLESNYVIVKKTKGKRGGADGKNNQKNPGQ